MSDWRGLPKGEDSRSRPSKDGVQLNVLSPDLKLSQETGCLYRCGEIRRLSSSGYRAALDTQRNVVDKEDT
jgi:hypothetical protein